MESFSPARRDPKEEPLDEGYPDAQAIQKQFQRAFQRVRVAPNLTLSWTYKGPGRPENDAEMRAVLAEVMRTANIYVYANGQNPANPHAPKIHIPPVPPSLRKPRVKIHENAATLANALRERAMATPIDTTWVDQKAYPRMFRFVPPSEQPRKKTQREAFMGYDYAPHEHIVDVLCLAAYTPTWKRPKHLNIPMMWCQDEIDPDATSAEDVVHYMRSEKVLNALVLPSGRRKLAHIFDTYLFAQFRWNVERRDEKEKEAKRQRRAKRKGHKLLKPKLQMDIRTEVRLHDLLPALRKGPLPFASEDIIMDPMWRKATQELGEDAVDASLHRAHIQSALAEHPDCFYDRVDDNVPVSFTSLPGFDPTLRFACFVVDGEPKVCLPQLIRELWRLSPQKSKLFMYAIEDYNLEFFPTSRYQQEMLRKAGVLNISNYVRKEGPLLVRKSDAARVLGELLPQYIEPSDETDDLRPTTFVVEHRCFGRHTWGRVYPTIRRIACNECHNLFTPESFVSHVHKKRVGRKEVATQIDDIVHWGFDETKWRNYINLPKDERNDERLCKLFNAFIFQPLPGILKRPRDSPSGRTWLRPSPREKWEQGFTREDLRDSPATFGKARAKASRRLRPHPTVQVASPQLGPATSPRIVELDENGDELIDVVSCEQEQEEEPSSRKRKADAHISAPSTGGDNCQDPACTQCLPGPSTLPQAFFRPTVLATAPPTVPPGSSTAVSECSTVPRPRKRLSSVPGVETSPAGLGGAGSRRQTVSGAGPRFPPQAPPLRGPTPIEIVIDDEPEGEAEDERKDEDVFSLLLRLSDQTSAAILKNYTDEESTPSPKTKGQRSSSPTPSPTPSTNTLQVAITPPPPAVNACTQQSPSSSTYSPCIRPIHLTQVATPEAFEAIAHAPTALVLEIIRKEHGVSSTHSNHHHNSSTSDPIPIVTEPDDPMDGSGGGEAGSSRETQHAADAELEQALLVLDPSQRDFVVAAINQFVEHKFIPQLETEREECEAARWKNEKLVAEYQKAYDLLAKEVSAASARDEAARKISSPGMRYAITDGSGLHAGPSTSRGVTSVGSSALQQATRSLSFAGMPSGGIPPSQIMAPALTPRKRGRPSMAQQQAEAAQMRALQQQPSTSAGFTLGNPLRMQQAVNPLSAAMEASSSSAGLGPFANHFIRVSEPQPGPSTSSGGLANFYAGLPPGSMFMPNVPKAPPATFTGTVPAPTAAGLMGQIPTAAQMIPSAAVAPPNLAHSAPTLTSPLMASPSVNPLYASMRASVLEKSLAASLLNNPTAAFGMGGLATSSTINSTAPNPLASALTGTTATSTADEMPAGFDAASLMRAFGPGGLFPGMQPGVTMDSLLAHLASQNVATSAPSLQPTPPSHHSSGDSNSQDTNLP